MSAVAVRVSMRGGVRAEVDFKVGMMPRQVLDDPRLTRQFQTRLVAEGVPLYWSVDVPLEDPAFDAVQLLATWGVWPGAPDDLRFRPDDLAEESELRRELRPAAPMLLAELPAGATRRAAARVLYERLRSDLA